MVDVRFKLTYTTRPFWPLKVSINVLAQPCPVRCVVKENGREHRKWKKVKERGEPSHDAVSEEPSVPGVLLEPKLLVLVEVSRPRLNPRFISPGSTSALYHYVPDIRAMALPFS